MCNIPNFNFSFKAKYDITTNSPVVVITNQSTGSNLANITYWFELTTPNGVLYHAGTSGSPDKSGVWNTFNVPENIPQSNGSIEFSQAFGYKIKGYAKDNLNNICELEFVDIICAPTGAKKSNFGAIGLAVTQKCNVGKLQIIDTSNYLYKGVIGALVSNETIFVYPANEEGVAPQNAVVNNKNAFTIPIPVNGKGHQLIRNSIYLYAMPSGNEVAIKYKYKNDNIEINCNVSLCSLMCGLSKYRQELTDDNGQCSPINQNKINELVLDIAQLTLALNNPTCGYDIESLHAKIKAELTKNNCICNDCPPAGNNDVSSLDCDDIDIQCVWNQISILLNTIDSEKDKFCALVSSCLDDINASTCSMPFISGVLFGPTSIVANFMLSNQQNSNSLTVFYKLHTSGTWVQAQVLASNATTYTISGTFTPGAEYDFKVVNNCTGGDVDSSIVTGIIPVAQDSCYFFNLMFGGLPNGIYGIEVNSSATPDCNKQKPKLLNSSFIASLMPCSVPVNVKINESAFLTWNAEPGDYEVSYKLKAAGSWTVHSVTSFLGTSQFKDLSALALSPLSDYEFRVIHKCSTSDSLPIYASTEEAPASICPSAGDFISFDESTGDLTWTGNGSAGTFIFKAYSGGTYLGNPLGVTFSASNTIIIADYSNILASVGVGDTINFLVYQDCGGGDVSDIQSHYYTMVGDLTPAACPSWEPAFSHSTISNDVIRINVSPGSTPDAKILFTQWQLRVNGVFAGTGILVIDGNYESRIKSLLQIKVGDLVEMRYRSFGNTKLYNIQASTAWGSWFGTTISTTPNAWDDVWKAIPIGWYLNGCSAGGTGAFYKISRDGKMQFRGSITSTRDYPNGTASVIEDFLSIDAGIYASLNANTLSTGNSDAFPLTVAGVSTTTCQAYGRWITRSGNTLTAVFTTINSGSANTNNIVYPISHIVIN